MLVEVLVAMGMGVRVEVLVGGMEVAVTTSTTGVDVDRLQEVNPTIRTRPARKEKGVNARFFIFSPIIFGKIIRLARLPVNLYNIIVKKSTGKIHHSSEKSYFPHCSGGNINRFGGAFMVHLP